MTQQCEMNQKDITDKLLTDMKTPNVRAVTQNTRMKKNVLEGRHKRQSGVFKIKIVLKFGLGTLGSFRFEYEYEIEYENDFSVVLCRLHIITTHTHLMNYPLCLKPT